LSSPQLRRFVVRALIDTSGAASPDGAQLASAFDTLSDRLRKRLQPLFGSRAVTALFSRARHLASAEFPWLLDIIPNGSEQVAADRLRTISGLEPAMLRDGLAAVLAHDIGLLSAFIGDDLVLPLVQDAWGQKVGTNID
jgi:hypothetical protein